MGLTGHVTFEVIDQQQAKTEHLKSKCRVRLRRNTARFYILLQDEYWIMPLSGVYVRRKNRNLRTVGNVCQNGHRDMPAVITGVAEATAQRQPTSQIMDGIHVVDLEDQNTLQDNKKDASRKLSQNVFASCAVSIIGQVALPFAGAP